MNKSQLIFNNLQQFHLSLILMILNIQSDVNDV